MSKFQVKTLSNIADVGLERLEGTHCLLNNESDLPDGVLVRSTKINNEHLTDNLMAISRAGAGVNNIPVDVCTEKGIVVFNTPGANANAVKELVLAGLMLSSRNIYSSIDFVNSLTHLEDMSDLEPFLEENKMQFKGSELAGSTLGVVGLGAIGSKVARMGVALNMNVVGYDPALSVQAAWKLPSQVHPADTLEELFKVSDYVSVHIPALESTKGIINETLFKQSKNLSLLNFARHEVVNTDDVLTYLDKNNLSNFITDFPTPKLIKRANNHKDVILLPHIGASTSQAEENCAVMAVNQLVGFLETGNIKNSINFPEVQIERTTENRITITNKNVPSMIGQIATTLGKLNLNIADMANVSRGEIAYNLIDIENNVEDEAIKAISKIENVVNVRLIK
ncbi:MAG: 3-phosphoglycerate dehydrogenase [Gammaproteobacteria bacterium]|jgi:D-3-phosphoglycerate dehydrogenase|nr:3-phosphoglycerate dehydrogenase [Gammaproteobacteria bacterium]|tara:strand:+ start:964 stop:2151 length:1188 start_codon:yes stop_codon:yes gene_type:complete